jgi:hypothetical protein
MTHGGAARAENLAEAIFRCFPQRLNDLNSGLAQIIFSFLKTPFGASFCNWRLGASDGLLPLLASPPRMTPSARPLKMS